MSHFVTQKYDTKAKVTFFFNDFKTRDANPEGFDSKMKNWIQFVAEYAVEENVLSFTVEQLRNAFEVFSLKPSVNCIRLVLTNMVRNGDLITEQSFRQQCTKSSDQKGWVGWGISNVYKIFSWSTSEQTHHSGYREIIDDLISTKQSLVYIKGLERMAHQVQTQILKQGLTNICMKYEEFEEKMLKSLELSGNSLELVVLYLQSRKQCTYVKENHFKIIKFGQAPSISERDVGLFKLETAKGLISTEIDKLEIEMEKCRDEARECVRSQNKFKAKQMIRRKMRLEDALNKRHTQYDNIELLEDQLRNSDSNKMIVDVFSQCAQVLKSAEVVPEDYEDVVSSMEEVFEKQNNFLSDIGRPLAGNLDEDDLEKELNELIDEENIDKRLEGLDSTAGRRAGNESPETNDLLSRLNRLREPISSSTKQPRTRIALGDDL